MTTSCSHLDLVKRDWSAHVDEVNKQVPHVSRMNYETFDYVTRLESWLTIMWFTYELKIFDCRTNAYSKSTNLFDCVTNDYSKSF